MTTPKRVSRVLQALRVAARSQTLVRIVRRDLPLPNIDGYVNKVGPALVLLQPVRDRIDLDGYDVIRVADITGVKASPRERYYTAALRLKGVHPAAPHPIDLSNMGSVLKMGMHHTPLLVIHREIAFPDECEIGRPRGVRANRYQLHWINPSAEFEVDDRVYKISDVTRVQFDGEYERTLALVSACRRRPQRGRRH